MSVEAPPAGDIATEPAARRQPAPPHPFVEFRQSFSANRGAFLGLIIVVALAIVALMPGLFAPHDPIHQYSEGNRVLRQLPPFWMDGADPRFLLGTDKVGRDLLSRLIWGARISMQVGLIVVTLSLAIGLVLGLVAGFFRGFFEIVILRVMDVIMAVPALLMAIVIVAILGPGLTNAMIAVSIVVLPGYVRLTRAAVLGERPKPYVVASEVAGAGLMRQMFVNVLPNCMPPLIVQATLGFSNAILETAALGFLNLGAQPPTPEWGTMLADARDLFLKSWWVMTFPGLAILVTVLSFNLMGDGLRDALDPKLKR
jgi:dipeptide transport system permease protein